METNNNVEKLDFTEQEEQDIINTIKELDNNNKEKNKKDKPKPFTKQKPICPQIDFEKPISIIQFTDRHNEEYEVLDVENKPGIIDKTYKDYLAQGLDPVVNNQTKLIYGLRTSIIPLNQRLEKMKNDFNVATNQLKEILKQNNELNKQQEQPKQEQPKQEVQVNDK